MLRQISSDSIKTSEQKTSDTSRGRQVHDPEDLELQNHLLEGVSRTFALTIPQLPPSLRTVVGNAYLLCRIADTIEDEPGLQSGEKVHYLNWFYKLVQGDDKVKPFALELGSKLTDSTIPAERELVKEAARVFKLLRQFSPDQRAAITRCIGIMTQGMGSFQEDGENRAAGLDNYQDMQRYCYHVAGVVGEMLTDLFCLYSPDIARHGERMRALSVGFGQGLQMTNILKDIHADWKHSACWLPADFFKDLNHILDGKIKNGDEKQIAKGLENLIGIAHGCLRQALEYTLCIPREEEGIRKFCLWALGFAVMTLRKMQRDPLTSLGSEVKISRRTVKVVIGMIHLLVRRDTMLRKFFQYLGKSLPEPVNPYTNFNRKVLSQCNLNPGKSDLEEISPDSLETAVGKSAEALREKQHESGYWSFDFEADCTITAEYILMMHYIGTVDLSLEERMARYLRKHQESDGSWPLYQGGGGDLSCTVKAYYALKLAGDDPGSEPMKRARQYILACGGAERSNVFTHYALAMFGQVSWKAVPFLPVEIMLFPKWFPFHISKISYWSRTVMIPLAVLYSHRAKAANPTNTGISELFISPREVEHGYFPVRSRCNWLFLRLERLARKGECLIPSGVRRLATRRAMDWIGERLNGTDGLGAIFPAMVNAYEALLLTGVPPDDPRCRQAREALEKLVIHRGEESFCQPCVSPVWDTALSALALSETGRGEDLESALQGLDWLKARQILEVRGDWAEKRPDVPPGGWPFQFGNDHYPDLDDTALVAFAMHKINPVRYEDSIHRAIAWLKGLQSRNGGFASFEVNNTQYYLNEIPFADHGALLDPPTADVSARCAMLFGATDGKAKEPDRALEDVLKYLYAEQEPDGSWYGRWGTNYIYGTWSVLTALEQCGDSHPEAVAKAVNYLKSRQRPDGGWGETNDSYEDPSLSGSAHRSTAFHTAWALLALMAAGENRSPAVTRGIRFLVNAQSEDGLWYDPEFTCPGFPRVFYLKYHGYDKYFPLWALARYRKELSGDTMKMSTNPTV